MNKLLVISLSLLLCVSCTHSKDEKLSAAESAAFVSTPPVEQPVRVDDPTDFHGVGTVSPIEGVSEQMLVRKSYVVSYNCDTRCPNWVAWHLYGSHTTGPIPRTNDYREDTDVPMPRACNIDYKKSGYTRGHLCPAGDNKWNYEAMSKTFLLTNICPQDRSLNTGAWNTIENSCRKWAEQYGDIYIVTGPMYFKSNTMQFIGENQVAVPDAFFKVVLCLNGPRAIGFIYRNSSDKDKKELYTYSLSQVERVTGLHFFPDLDSLTRADVENLTDFDRTEGLKK